MVNSIFQWSIVSGRLFGGSKPSIWVLPNLRKYHSMRYEEKFVCPCAVFDQSDFESFTQSELEAPWSIFWRIALDKILELCLSLAGFHRFFISLETKELNATCFYEGNPTFWNREFCSKWARGAVKHFLANRSRQYSRIVFIWLLDRSRAQITEASPGIVQNQ